MIWKCFPVVKLFVGSSLDIASCLLAGFPPSLLGLEGDLGIVLPGITFVYFLLWEAFTLCSVHGSSCYSTCYWKCCCFQTRLRYLVSFKVLFHWHYSWWNLLLVSRLAGPLPSLSNWKWFLVAWAGPCVKFHPSLHSSSAWRHEKERERALHFTSMSLLQWLERDSSLPPRKKCILRERIMLSLAVVNREGPEESGRRELLKREHVLSRRFASMLPLGRNSYSVQYGEQGCCMEGPSHWFSEPDVMVAQFL